MENNHQLPASIPHLKYSAQNFEHDVAYIANSLKSQPFSPTAIMAMARGGLPLGVALSNILDLPMFVLDKPLFLPPRYLHPHQLKSLVVVDDIIDSGDTIKKVVNNIIISTQQVNMVEHIESLTVCALHNSGRLPITALYHYLPASVQVEILAGNKSGGQWIDYFWEAGYYCK